MLRDNPFGLLIFGIFCTRFYECTELAITDADNIAFPRQMKPSESGRISRHIINTYWDSSSQSFSDIDLKTDHHLVKKAVDPNTTNLDAHELVKRRMLFNFPRSQIPLEMRDQPVFSPRVSTFPFLNIRDLPALIASDHHNKIPFVYPYIQDLAMMDLSAVKIIKIMRTDNNPSCHLEAMKKIIHIFFPDKISSYHAWDRMVKKIMPLMQLGPLQYNLKNLVGRMLYMKNKLLTLLDEKQEKKNTTCPIISYLRFMSGYEDQFVSTLPSYTAIIDNYMLLPIYSRVINLKLALFTWATQYSEVLELKIPDVLTILDHRKELVNKAVGHVENIASVEYIFNTPKGCLGKYKVYDCMLGVRTYIAANGEAYTSYWQNSVDPSMNIINHNAVFFSKSYGENSLDFYLLAVNNQYKIPPLTPNTITIPVMKFNTLNQIKSIIISYDKISKDQILSGAIIYEDGNSIHMGSTYPQASSYSISETLQLQGSYIKQLSVSFGDNYLSSLTFYLTDGRKKQFGREKYYVEHVYMKNHFIAGILLGYANKDEPFATTIGVSFQLPPLYSNWHTDQNKKADIEEQTQSVD